MEEAFGRTAIAPSLDEYVDHVAVLIDGPPEILLAPWMFTNSSSRCQVSPKRPGRRLRR
jgi:hypothetical protein